MNVYEIFTKLTLQNNASAAIGAIAKEVLNLEGGIGRLTKAMDSLNRTSMAIGGGLAFAGGLGIGAVLKSAANHAKELSHELVQVQRLGLSSSEYQKAYDAIMKLPSAVAGTTSAAGAKVWSELFSVLGADETTKNLNKLSAFTMSLANTKGIGFNEAAANLRDMVRSADLLRKFVDPNTRQVSHARLEHFLELGSRVVTATRGVVGPETWLALAQQGGPVLSTMTDEGLMTMAIVAQYMKGRRAGTALTSAFQQFGGGIMRQSSAEEAAKLGLIGPGSLEGVGSFGRGGHWRPGRGSGRVIFDAQTLDTPFARSLQQDPAISAQILEQQLLSHGFDTVEKQMKELFKIFGRQTTQRLMSDLLGNLPQLLEERKRVGGALGITAGNQLANAEDYEQAQRNLNAAYEDMVAKISLPSAQAAIPLMSAVGDFFLGMGRWAIKPEHAETLKNIGIGLAFLSTWFVGAGGAALLVALGPVGWIPLGIMALGLTILAYKDPIKNFLNSGWVNGAMDTLNKIQQSITDMFQGTLDWIRDHIPAWMWKEAYTGGGFGGGGMIRTSFGGGGGLGYGGGTGDFGMGSGKSWNQMMEAEQTNLLAAQTNKEGWYPGSRSFINNNPGNIKYGDFAKAHGATGESGGFAVFPNVAAGAAAQRALWGSSRYASLPLNSALSRWGTGALSGVGGGSPGAGVFNFMHGQFGGRGQNIGTFYTDSGRKVQLNNESAPHILGFLNGLEAAGAPIPHALGGFVNRNIAGGGVSQHAFGNAVDIESHGRNASYPEFLQWYRTHEAQVRQLERQFGMKSGADMSHPDFGHWEWGGGSGVARKVTPYRRHQPAPVIENTMYLDGEVVHRSVVRRIVKGMTHPTTGPYHDGSRHWTPPDAGLVGV